MANELMLTDSNNWAADGVAVKNPKSTSSTATPLGITGARTLQADLK